MKMAQYAQNFTEFTEKSISALCMALNDTETGKQLMDDLLKQSLEKNPALTQDEWSKIKQDFLTFCFFAAVQESPEAMHELAGHVYNELNGGKEND